MADPDSMRRNAFEYAHRNRMFEIEMFWRRSLIFWGFISAAFIGLAALGEKSAAYSVVFTSFGLVCSVVWALGNRGSKYWQEYWEKKVKENQQDVTGEMFVDSMPATYPWYAQFAPRRKSVSKLVMGLSDYSVVVWLLLVVYSNVTSLTGPHPVMKHYGLTIFSVCTVLYTIYLYKVCDSED